MPFQHLHDFSTLQIPDVYFAILRARNNPFSYTRNTEASKQAIATVHMTSVSFETPSSVIVP